MTGITSIPVRKADGGESDLCAYAGEVLLIVNTASKCGFTPQYAGLEALYRAHKDRGFAVLAFPATSSAGRSRAMPRRSRTSVR
jgi:glutathione peroxidase